MKKILLGATVALLMTGCAQNELLDGGVATPNDGKVRFAATSGVPTNTRAAAGNPYTSTADLQNLGLFSVVGYSGSTPIVGSVTKPQQIKFNGVSWEYWDGTKYSNDEPYWPSTAMNFFAYANWAGLTAPTISDAGITADVTIADDALTTDGQKDLLVAATLDATKQVRTLLTFKHALTQIVFKAGNVNSTKLQVRIGGVQIVNVAKTGKMEFLAAKNKIEWPSADLGNQDKKYSVQGLETTDVDDTQDAVAAVAPFTVPKVDFADRNKYDKFARIQNDKEPANNALMLIPQDFKPWDTNSGDAANKAGQTGAYLVVQAILNAPGTTEQSQYYCGTYKDGGTADEYGYIYIPLESTKDVISQWTPGKRINYIITFGDNEGGSGGGGYDKDGEPILVPIKFRAVVEDWVEVNVPLLTASFEASSTQIDYSFINGFTNQLLADIKAAPAPKVYKAEIKLKGMLKENIGGTPFMNMEANYVTAQLASIAMPVSSKFRPGSTVTYDFTGVTEWKTQTIQATVPTGWEARIFNIDTEVAPTVGVAALKAGDAIPDIDGKTANRIVLTKVATRGYDFHGSVDYVEDHLATVELNENWLPGAVFNRTIELFGKINPIASSEYFYFSSDYLNRFTHSNFNTSTVVLDVAEVTNFSASGTIVGMETFCPEGWTMTVAGIEDSPGVLHKYFPGDNVKINAATQNITYTKATGVLAHKYVKAAILNPYLALGADTNQFYWDNVDFDVAIDFNTANPFVFTNNVLASNETLKIWLKYPITKSRITGSNGFSVDASFTKDTDLVTFITYTKP